jgi:DNA excision repair protein ERCC-8
MVVTPPGLSGGGEVLVWPNDQEMLLLDLHNGNLITRLRSPGATNPVGPRGAEMGRNRITTIVWRGAGGGSGQIGTVMGGGNSMGAIYSAHLDGQIRAWMPLIPGPDDVDETEDVDQDDKAVDSAYRSLMGRQITFTGGSNR